MIHPTTPLAALTPPRGPRAGETLAHGGGVPETLSVLVPLALVVVMLRLGAKKAPKDNDDDEDDQQSI